MEYRHLGRTGLRVSPLCLGTMNFGPQTNEADSHADHGPRARAGHQLLRHRQRLRRRRRAPSRSSAAGSPRAAAGARRSCSPPRSTAARDAWPNTSRLSALHIRQACEDSLRRLQTDHIDLYQMHHVDRDTPWDEIWQAMDLLVAQGKVIYVGSSNFAGWHIAQANEAAAPARLARARVGAEPLQPAAPARSSSRCSRRAEAYGLGVIPWSPLAGGLLGGALRKVTEGRRGRRARAAAGRARTATSSRRGRRCAPSSARSPPTWRWPGCCTSRRSPRRSSARARWSSSQGSLRALEITLDQDTLDRLDAIFPGPGGAAPEAYAW